MFDVIEHCPDPLTALRAAGRYVKPGGLLLVGTGDMSAWTWRVLGSEHWYVESPQHISFLTADFFRRVSDGAVGRLIALHRGGHRQGSLIRRFSEGVQAVYFWFRRRGGLWRLPQVIIQSLPTWAFLKHKQRAPYLMHLHDHLLAVYRREA
jgi:SAM-dependent methyltransferase